MKTSIRTALVDPDSGTRQELSQILGGVAEIVLDGVHVDYRAAGRALSARPPELTLVAVDGDRDQALELVRAIKAANPHVVVIPASRRSEADEILRFIRAGAPDYLHLPATVDDLRALIGRLPSPHREATRAPSRKLGRVLTVAGASGGVGCTSIAVNLAAALAEDRVAKVAFVDLDLLFGSVATSLNLSPAHGLLEVLDSSDRLDQQLLQRSLVRHEESGLHILPGPALIEDSSRVEPEPLSRVIAMLAELFDYLVVDTSKALQVTDMIALERSDRILMVVQSELVNLYHSARLLALFRRLDGLDDRVRVVLNRAGSESGSISTKKVEGTLGRPVFAQVPNAYRAFQDARTYGAPIERRGAAKRAHPALAQLARQVRSDLGVQPAEQPHVEAPARRARFWSIAGGERPGAFQPAPA